MEGTVTDPVSGVTYSSPLLVGEAVAFGYLNVPGASGSGGDKAQVLFRVTGGSFATTLYKDALIGMDVLEIDTFDSPGFIANNGFTSSDFRARATKANIFLVRASIGDRVWKDTNRDGDQNCTGTGGLSSSSKIPGDGGSVCTEPGKPGVPVQLTNCAGTVLDTKVTDDQGFYLFTGLTPGAPYCVKFNPPQGCVLTTRGATGAKDLTDSDPDPVSGLTESIPLGVGETDRTWDAGLVCDIAIDIEKFTNGLDADDPNGVATTVPPPDVPRILPGAPITWRYAVKNVGQADIYQEELVVEDDVEGVLWNLGTLVQGALVDKGDGDGILAVGEVWVFELDGTAQVLVDTVPGSGSDHVVQGCRANPGDPTGETRPTYENLGIAKVVVQGAVVDRADDPSHYCNPDLVVGDRLWKDLNRNGVQDCQNTNGNSIVGDVVLGQEGNPAVSDQGPECGPGAGVPNQPVYLLSGDCTTSLAQTTTDGQGFYGFDLDQLGYGPGQYCVRFERPSICGPLGNQPALFTLRNVGDDLKDSDVDRTTGLTGSFPVPRTTLALDLGWDAGVVCPVAIGNYTWVDTNVDGIQQPGEPAFNGLGVKVYACGADGKPGGTGGNADTLKCTLTTGASGGVDDGDTAPAGSTPADGWYQCANLDPTATYYVQFGPLPAGYEYTLANQGGNDSFDSDANGNGLAANPDGTCFQPVPNPKDVDPRWDVGLKEPVANCDLTVNKTCAVLTPPSTNWVCSEAKPLDVLTMISGFSSPVKVKAWKGAVGTSTLLTTIDNIQPGQEVSVSGYAGSPNDVYWEVFQAGTSTKIGTSTFHVSCSDVDMNGPEDCGKAQGDGKAKTGFLNSWVLEGLSGNGKTLDCTSTPAFPTAEACTLFPTAQPSCVTEGKPTELVFKYTVKPGDPVCAISNLQGGKATCSVTGAFNPALPAFVQAAGSSSLSSDVYTVVPTTVNPDGSVTVTFNGSTFKADSYFRLSQSNNRVDLKIHTSCSQPLAVGDKFGPLTLVGFNGATGGSQVLYGYELKNLGDPVTVASIVDDKLGAVTDCAAVPPGDGLPGLASGEVVRCTKEGLVTETTTNVVTVTAALASGKACPATDSLTVTVQATAPGTGTPGYWKNHPEAWPVESITIGNQTYTKAEALALLTMAVAEPWPDNGSDVSLILFRALVAAKLNVLVGNESSCVDTTIAKADAWMVKYAPNGVPANVAASSRAWKEGEPLYKTLDDYNNGLLCAPSRGS
jgi:hypothetical protein